MIRIFLGTFLFVAFAGALGMVALFAGGLTASLEPLPPELLTSGRDWKSAVAGALSRCSTGPSVSFPKPKRRIPYSHFFNSPRSELMALKLALGICARPASHNSTSGVVQPVLRGLS